MKHGVWIAAILILTLVFTAAARGQTRVLDPMDAPTGWVIRTSDDVALTVTPEPAPDGTCLRLDYHFQSGTGFAIIQKVIPLEMPENYEFAFRLRGVGPANNLEFKLLDESGDSVWWHMRRAFDWPQDWRRLVTKKRDIEFAWGPAAGAPLEEVARIEFVVSSNSGGKGTIWLDDFTFRPLPKARTTPVTLRAAAGSAPDTGRAIDADPTTAWTTTAPASITVDQGEAVEFGAVEIAWTDKPSHFTLDTSDDGQTWSPLAAERAPGIAATIVPTANAQARYVRVSVTPAPGGSAGIADLKLRPADFTATPNAMFQALAKERPRGMLPRQFLNEQSYWTVIGADGATAEALINEEGMIEVGKRLFSIEPAVRNGGFLSNWANAKHTQSLRAGYLPIPTVVRSHQSKSLAWELSTTTFVDGDAEASTLYILYTLRNTGTKPLDTTLDLAVRPFQVNPPWQRLNFEGGVAHIRTIAARNGALVINTDRTLVPLTPGSRAGVTTWAQGEVFDWLASGTAPTAAAATCPDGLASGLISYPAALAPGESKTFVIAIALEGSPTIIQPGPGAQAAVEAQLARVAAAWDERVSRATITVPKADHWLVDTFKAQLAYILINRDGPAIQPGSRSYERSWARDGSLTSSALLACGHAEEVRVWIDWYSEHLFENGKVPCVVDARGPDPVPEHDSHGQYIWAVANYYRHTRDRAFLETHWPRVQRVVAYIQSLRAERMTDEYKTDQFPQNACYGLVPESISHEGYSAKPMHSYWDDFFVLLGLREAAWLAGESGDSKLQAAYAAELADFTKCFHRSIAITQAHHKIDYIPGCVELGDFDATSTTIAFYPCDAADPVLEAGLNATFERYWKFAVDRMSPTSNWDGYTPYELRIVGSLVRLNQRENAYTLLQWFRTHLRPQGWRHWAEVVFNDPLSPRFIGDMPHTWVGSDYLNSIISMFAYEQGDSIVLFAGVPDAWIKSGEPIAFTNIITSHGPLSGSMLRTDRQVRIRVEGDLTIPASGLILRAPAGAAEPDAAITSLPAEVVFNLR